MTITVGVPRRTQYEEVLRLLYARLEPAERELRVASTLESLHRGELPSESLQLAERAGQPVGAVLSMVQPDQTAFVWPPELVPGAEEGDEIADALLTSVAGRLDRGAVWLGQCILEPEETWQRAVMVRNGYPHLTDMLYLERVLGSRPLPAPESGLEAHAYDPSTNRARFVRMLEQTYLRTLDCPEMNGLRTADETFDSHRLSGEFEPSRWNVFSDGGSDVGVLLLNDHPDQDAWEIVYLGVGDGHRGRGHGRAMLTWGCRAAQQARRSSVLVAVDCRNSYARKIYSDAGFVELAVRSVHLRIRPRGGAPS